MITRFLIIFSLIIIASVINESFADETIEIKLGQEIQFNDLNLNFYDVRDSRCPSDLTCIWEGNVTAMIAAKNQTHRVSGLFTPGYVLSYITPYEITLVDLQPHPISTEETKYVATINISQPEKKAEVNYKDFRETKNPNECWYQDDDGNIIPCTIDSTGPSMITGMFLVVFWPYIILGISIGVIFIIWRKRK